jgi:uncharacterized protein YecT (DUF1311 family)
MWVRFALAAIAMTALHDGAAADPRTVLSQTAASPPATTAAPMPQTQAEPGEQPPFKPMTFPARGDGLDEWCKEVKSGSLVAMCSDDELRALAVERLRAFNAASSRLFPDRQKILAADQNGWALSYPQRCNLPSNVLPSLPLAPEVRECMAKAGRSRLAYLQNYGLAEAATSSSVPAAGSAATASVPEPAPPLSPPISQPPAAVPPPPAAAARGAATGEASPPPIQIPQMSAGRGPAKPSTGDLLTGRAILTAGFQGVVAIGAILVASVVVALWVWAAVKNRRRRIG